MYPSPVFLVDLVSIASSRDNCQPQTDIALLEVWERQGGKAMLNYFTCRMLRNMTQSNLFPFPTIGNIDMPHLTPLHTTSKIGFQLMHTTTSTIYMHVNILYSPQVCSLRQTSGFLWVTGVSIGRGRREYNSCIAIKYTYKWVKLLVSVQRIENRLCLCKRIFTGTCTCKGKIAF